MEDPYARKQGIEVDLRNVIYYNYTIRGLLDPSRKNIKYDNVERNGGDNKEIKARFESQGHDKVLTLTHCRFEAKAMLGVEDVLVTDADEFIYCPQGAPTSFSIFTCHPFADCSYCASFTRYTLGPLKPSRRSDIYRPGAVHPQLYSAAEALWRRAAHTPPASCL
jgi:hypothetical protein